MKHDVVLEGYGCRMRPAELEDAGFIVHLRNLPHARGNISDTSASIEKQREWLIRYFDRPGDYYWILEESGTGRSVGTYGLYDIHGGTGVPGRWVMLPDADFSIAATTLLVCQFAFENLGLDKLVFNVVSTNQKALKFHRLFGARETHVGNNGEIINGHPVDFVWFELTKPEWPALFAKWDRLIG